MEPRRHRADAEQTQDPVDGGRPDHPAGLEVPAQPSEDQVRDDGHAVVPQSGGQDVPWQEGSAQVHTGKPREVSWVGGELPAS